MSSSEPRIGVITHLSRLVASTIFISASDSFTLVYVTLLEACKHTHIQNAVICWDRDCSVCYQQERCPSFQNYLLLCRIKPTSRK
jgi:hypothetical protein